MGVVRRCRVAGGGLGVRKNVAETFDRVLVELPFLDFF